MKERGRERGTEGRTERERERFSKIPKTTYRCEILTQKITPSRGVKCNFTKQPVDQHRLINLYNLHVYIYIYRSVFIQVPLRQCSTRCYGAYDTIDDQKFSGYISTLFDRSVSWGQVTCLPIH